MCLPCVLRLVVVVWLASVIPSVTASATQLGRPMGPPSAGSAIAGQAVGGQAAANPTAVGGATAKPATPTTPAAVTAGGLTPISLATPTPAAPKPVGDVAMAVPALGGGAATAPPAPSPSTTAAGLGGVRSSPALPSSTSALGLATGTTTPAASSTSALGDTIASGVAATPLAVTDLAITPSGTKISSGYSWQVFKRFASGQTTEAVSVPVGGTGTATYQIVVTKGLVSQQVAVAGTFAITGSGNFDQPSVTLAPAPAAATTPSVNCVPTNMAPATCSFSLSWSDSSVSAAAGGTVTVAVGGKTANMPYNFAGASAATGTGQCATITDTFAGGTLTANNYQVTGSYPPANMQLCDSGDKVFQYTVTFQNMEQAWCSAPITANNIVTVTPTGASPVTASATATVTVTGCTGSTAVTIGDIKTTIINTYTWTLEKTGGGSGLTTTPDAELSIPFTITATQALTTALGYVAGKATFSNPGGSAVTLSTFSVALGTGGPQSIVLANCAATTVAASSSTSCAFNVTATNAPAAGTVTASFMYTASGAATTSSGGATAATVSSTPVSYAFTNAETFNLGGTANLYDTIDTSALTTVAGQVTGVQSVARLSPADAAPPATAPGVTLSGSKTFTYSVIVSRLLSCSTDRTITNTATLTPVGGNQGVLSQAASATFSVTGCSQLPTVTLSNIQTWAAVTYTWTMQKTATPNVYQVNVGAGATANYAVQLTRTYSTGNFFMSGSLVIVNPSTYPMTISSVTLMSTTGQVGALPPVCLGGSNVGGSTISTSVNNINPFANPYLGAASTNTGSFAIGAGAQIQCVFNVSAGSGSAPQGNVYAQATTTSSYVGSSGNTAISQNIPIDLSVPTQRWEIGGCVMFSDAAVTQGVAGMWTPTMTGLPRQERICGNRNYQYGGVISPVPAQGAECNKAMSIVNTASAVPDSGSQAVTATATIQVMAIGCAGASPLPTTQQMLPPSLLPPSPLPTQLGKQQSASPLVPTVQADSIRVTAAGGYDWAVAVTSDVDARGASLAVQYGGTRRVLYTVTARRKPAFNYFVSGLISVQNTYDGPVTATAVVAQLPMGTVPAACPGGRAGSPVQVRAGSSIECLFNASLTAAAPGTIAAVATSSFGSTTSASSVPYSMDVTPKDAPGGCAVLADAVATQPVLPVGSVSVVDNRPAGAQSPPVCGDTAYNFTATFGPFAETACSTYTVTAAASATPTDASQSPVTGKNALQLRVDGCPATTLSASAVSVVASPPVGRSTASYQWTAKTDSGAFMTYVSYTEATTLAFNITWTRVDASTSRLAGSLLVTNPTNAPVDIRSASVLPDFSGDASSGGAAAATATQPAVIDATCTQTSVPARGSVNCSYVGTVAGGGSGVLVAQVALSNGASVSSSSVPFKLPQSTSKGAQSGSAGCADLITGLFLSPAMLLAGQNGTAPANNSADQFTACDSGGKTVTLRLGPFKDTDCGQYAVTLTTRVRPSAASGQLPFATVAPVRMEIRGCPLTETPKPEVVIPDDNLTSSIVVRYPWKLTKSADNADPLQLRYDRAQDVAVSVAVERGPGQRSVGLVGSVLLNARGTKPVTVDRVQVGVLQRLGELKVETAVCPESARAANGTGGGFIVPPRPAKLACTFRVSGMPPMDGAITALVYEASGADGSPLPAEPTVYRVANAPRVPLGECAVVGAGRALKKAGSEFAVEGQPSMPARSALPSTPVCGSLAGSYTLAFGPFGAGECGRYTFTSDVSAKPFNTTEAVKSPLNFDVVVGGCKGGA